MKVLEAEYQALKRAASTDVTGDKVRELLCDIAGKGYAFLREKAEVCALTCEVPGKEYFSFRIPGTDNLSRPVNKALFAKNIDLADVARILSADVKGLSFEKIDQLVYTAAMSYCCTADLTRTNDKATPGRYFEIFVGQIFGRAYGVKPTRLVEVLKLGEEQESGLPTDYVYVIGKKSRILLPVKTSTRERSIEVWAHQRILDGVYGVGTFTGILVCIAETNAKKGFRMTETCVPGQWKLYQKFIARLERVYYLDPPRKYLALAEEKVIAVRQFSAFFREYEGFR